MFADHDSGGSREPLAIMLRVANAGSNFGSWLGLLDLSSWPKGMRVIVRKERPHPGAQLRFTDFDGHRVTCFATSTRTGQLAYLELLLSAMRDGLLW